MIRWHNGRETTETDRKAIGNLSPQQQMYINLITGRSHHSSVMWKKKWYTARCWQCTCEELSACCQGWSCDGQQEISLTNKSACFSKTARNLFLHGSFYLLLRARILVMPVPGRNGLLHTTLHKFNTAQETYLQCQCVNIAWITCIHPDLHPLQSI